MMLKYKVLIIHTSASVGGKNGHSSLNYILYWIQWGPFQFAFAINVITNIKFRIWWLLLVIIWNILEYFVVYVYIVWKYKLQTIKTFLIAVTQTLIKQYMDHIK